jgi:hypothetical protein
VPPTQFPALSEQALAAVERIPGVVAAAMSNRAPLDQSTPATSVEASADRARRVSDVTVSFVTTRYFDVVTIPLVAGRTFTATETSDAANVVIVNQALAALLWPLEDPLGRGLVTSPEDGPLRVIGVAANARYRSITESSQPHLYRPTRPALGLTLLARTQADGRETLRAMQRELDGVGPGLVGFFPRTLEDHLAIQLLPMRVASTAASVLSALALVLSAGALYALVAWFVALRRREIGVRMTLGASTWQVRRFVVRQAVVAVAPGVVGGGILAAVLASTARRALYGVTPFDPVALATAIGAALVVVAVGAYGPSRRATAVDPAAALRE